MEYSPLHPRSTFEAAVLIIAAFLLTFAQMPYFACAVASINYLYAIRRHRHAIAYKRWKKTKPVQATAKQSHLSDAEENMQTLLDDRGFPAKVIGSSDSFRRTVFEVRLPRSFSIKKLTGDIMDMQRASGMKGIIIDPVVTGKPGVSRILLPKLKTPAPLMMRDVMETEAFKNAHPMALPLGMNLNGEHEYCRLDKLPHVAIAGTTGSGKSVEVNTWITSLIVKNTPEQLQLVLVDPKMLELSIYDKSQHLAIPVVTEMSEAKNAVDRLVSEMEYRYKCLAAAKVRNLEAYHKKLKAGKILNPVFAEDQADKNSSNTVMTEKFSVAEKYLKPMPRIVFVGDEMADLMMMFKSDIEIPITRLAQKGRACNIHLILATQRPEVSVLTGLIKANIPARFSMQVTSDIDSRIILDRSGAQNLLGDGDGYFAANQNADLMNVQGFLIEAEEIEAIIEKQNKAAA